MGRADFRRHVRFLAGVHGALGAAVGAVADPGRQHLFRSVDKHEGHYQDNRVEWLLDARRNWAHLRAYRNAGVVALLFGGGQGADTSVQDARDDGVTNPAPVNGNRRRARVADDDGGYFRERAQAYRRHGPLTLAR